MRPSVNDDATRTESLKTPSRSTSESHALRITVTHGIDAGRVFEVKSARAVVGRSADADARLADPTVSQFHAELRAAANGIVVVDLGSTNGTRAGSIAVRDASVPTGTMVSFGSTTARVEVIDGATVPRSNALSFGGLVGGSEVMRELYAVLERLARTDLALFLEGPTGTGKEVAARALHEHSRRAGAPFVALDCTTIPPTLAESVLFGHERGAFTGANEKRIGIFEAAANGTLLLDEVGELPAEMQPKLLRVLERREVLPVGSTKPRPIHARIVSATWRDLRSLVNKGAFREDLYHRLAQARVRMPSLAERVDDIGMLAEHFLANIPWDVTAARAIAPDALALIEARTYSGNLRELKNTVERAAMLAAGSVITVADLTFERLLASEQRAAESRPIAASPSDAPSEIEPYKDARREMLDAFERGYLERLLARAGTNLSLAARLARVDRQTLRELLSRHGLRGTE